jgi:uncharacterized membrane protein YbhN (UPF0104 family)
VISGRNAVFLAGAIVCVLLLGSVGIARRDVWFRALKRHRRAVELVVLGAVVAVAAALLVAHHDQLQGILERIEDGNPLWLAIAAACEIASFAGYVLLVRIIHSPLVPRLDLPASIEFTLAGVVATRLLSAGGAGGIAFAAWVLHRAGMPSRIAARRLFAFLVVLYTTYMGALILGGIVVIAGVGNVPRALGITALAVGGLVTVAVGLMLVLPLDIPVLRDASEAIGEAISIMRDRPASLVGSVAWWAGDIATLWASFRAFGQPPAVGIVILCYFLAQLGNLLPLPGGVGGTEGGMTGAFVACGVSLELTIVSVVTYQVISSYLPAIPGLPAYAALRRRMRGWGDGAAEPEAEPAPA